jgi:hypothetical protein
MIAEKKKQVQTLAVLVVVLAAVVAYTYLANRTPSAGAAPSPADKITRTAPLATAGTAQIRLDLIGGKDDKEIVGRRNVFQYYVPPKPPPPPPPPPPPVTASRGNSQSQNPPPPPPPPFSALSTFKFDGVGIVAKPGKLVASIMEGTNNRYNVTEGEYILGRYRINRITENSVEIEDVDQNRRQTYTRRTEP